MISSPSTFHNFSLPRLLLPPPLYILPSPLSSSFSPWPFTENIQVKPMSGWAGGTLCLTPQRGEGGEPKEDEGRSLCHLRFPPPRSPSTLSFAPSRLVLPHPLTLFPPLPPSPLPSLSLFLSLSPLLSGLPTPLLSLLSLTPQAGTVINVITHERVGEGRGK